MRNIIFFIVAFLPLISFGQVENKPEQSILRVQGDFVIKQKPENIIVNISIVQKDLQYKVCFDRALDSLQKLKKSFAKNGINNELIRILDISVREDFDWKSGDKIKIGYQASIKLEIETKYTNGFTENLIKTLNENYLYYSIRFKLSETQKEALREMALKESVIDATIKAKIIAEASNIELGSINKIIFETPQNYSSFIDDDIVNERVEALFYDKDNPDREIDFNPKEILIRKIIIVEWNIKK